MTKRSQNYRTENAGVRYVMGVVQEHNSIFQPIARENDQGNDCYIEFVENGRATNFAIFVQIKSGASYKDSLGYKIPADKSHMDYWAGSNSPSIGIVYDPERDRAYWIDIIAYLKQRPDVLKQKHHSIRLEAAQEFSQETFTAFAAYCKELNAVSASDAGFSKSLSDFAQTDIPSICYEGFKSLVSVHKEKPASWNYITMAFSKIKEQGIQGTILGMISNYVRNADILYLNQSASDSAAQMVVHNVKKNFRRAEVEAFYPFIADGIVRGGFSYRAYMVLVEIEGLSEILQQISFDPSTSADKRLFWFWLYLNTHKLISARQTMQAYDLFIEQYPEALDDEALTGVMQSTKEGDLFKIG